MYKFILNFGMFTKKMLKTFFEKIFFALYKHNKATYIFSDWVASQLNQHTISLV